MEKQVKARAFYILLAVFDKIMTLVLFPNEYGIFIPYEYPELPGCLGLQQEPASCISPFSPL